MAEQTARNWSSGDIVTAANLKSIERGVSAVAEEYTPTTWANGNTVTAAGLNNIEQGIANAGGGSSDFSTATVTVVGNGSLSASMPYCIDAEGFEAIEPMHQDYTAGTYEIALWKGKAASEISGTFSVSGNIQNIVDDMYLITGDCTITISKSSGGVK